MKKETDRVYTGSHEEGLRALVRIIARAYIRDIRDKNVTKDEISHKLKRGKRIRNKNKGGKSCQRKNQ